uniref:Uncharacterized protein n=1 Tax=Clastoptera arizonana TaxID=38151 RepID=A0A1B6DJN1_9HEMI
MSTIEDFLCILSNEKKRLISLCIKWQEVLDTQSKCIPEEAAGHILSAIGQTKLLLQNKIEQFQILIQDCKLQRGSKKVLIDDLVGFWDLISMQVEDLDQKFEMLEGLMKQNWKNSEELYLQPGR